MNLFAREAARRSRRFGWDWFMWNFLLASTPPLCIWYGLSKVKVAMKEKVATLQEKELLRLAIEADDNREKEERSKDMAQKLQELEEKLMTIEARLEQEKMASLAAAFLAVTTPSTLESQATHKRAQPTSPPPSSSSSPSVPVSVAELLPSSFDYSSGEPPDDSFSSLPPPPSTTSTSSTGGYLGGVASWGKRYLWDYPVGFLRRGHPPPPPPGEIDDQGGKGLQ